MVGSLGMGGSLISYDAAAVSGAGNVVAKVLANDSARTSVEEILDDAKAVAAGLLHDHAHVLEALRDALLEREELVGEEILDVIRRATGEVVDVVDLTEDSLKR
jgi:ATP-dependent Zn protease